VSLVEQDMRDVITARIDDQSADPSDVPIRGVYLVAAAHLHLARGHTVKSDLLGLGIRAQRASRESVVGLREQLLLCVAPVARRSGQEMGLLGFLKRVELSLGAAQADLLGRRRD
jgi:hypothetical protein